jgi:predicted tellurium resistance membrane protein TerC
MIDFSALLTFEGLMAFLTLTLLEVVLGIDNLIFISLIVSRVEKEKQRFTRILGLVLALVFRIALLLSISWVMRLDNPIFNAFDIDFSIKDIILIVGGLFLLFKSTTEIRHKLTHLEDDNKTKPKSNTNQISFIIMQIIAIDMVFSIDSILTAIGMTKEIGIMILAVIVSIIFMILFARMVGDFINENPTIVMLALSFLLMIGTLLIADGFHFHVPRGYVYFALGFSLMVEVLNLFLLKRMRKDK